MYQKPNLFGSENNWGMESKNGLLISEGISCSSFYVKEFDVIVHKMHRFIKFLAILYSKSLANLVVQAGTRHSHRILLEATSHTPLTRLGLCNSLGFLHGGKGVIIR